MSFFGNRRQPEPEPEIVETRIPHPQPPQQPMISSPQPIGFETVLGANSSLEGKLVSTSNVRLDGSFSGTLEINGNVLIGETAKINADINAKNISVAGAVRGNINGKKVQILRTGRVWGDIIAMALTTEEGAFIDGKISMSNHEAAGSPTPPPAPIAMSAPIQTTTESDTPNREPDFLSDEDTETSER